MLSLELSPRALRDLRRLPPHAAEAILTDLEILKTPPWPGPPKVKRIHGTPYARLRIGEFRSVVIREESKVVVLRITARKDFERVLKTL